jgi:hypothetical protein
VFIHCFIFRDFLLISLDKQVRALSFRTFPRTQKDTYKKATRSPSPSRYHVSARHQSLTSQGRCRPGKEAVQKGGKLVAEAHASFRNAMVTGEAIPRMQREPVAAPWAAHHSVSNSIASSVLQSSCIFAFTRSYPLCPRFLPHQCCFVYSN